ncbi:hypothetical protein ACET3Z_012302 [Daucus carota]
MVSYEGAQLILNQLATEAGSFLKCYPLIYSRSEAHGSGSTQFRARIWKEKMIGICFTLSSSRLCSNCSKCAFRGHFGIMCSSDEAREEIICFVHAPHSNPI